MSKEPRHHCLQNLSPWDEFSPTVGAGSPERMLMCAVLQRAILDYLHPNRTPPGALRTARAFFEESGDMEGWPFSFQAIAATLAPNGDAEGFKAAVRKRLAAKDISIKTVKPR